MKLEEAIQIRKNSEEPVEESLIGDAVRIISGATGVGLGFYSVISGAVAAAVGVTLTPVVIGAGGAIAAAAGVKLAFDIAYKIENRQLMRKIDKLAEVIAERDELLAEYDDDETTRKRQKQIKSEVKPLTEKQKRLGDDINREMRMDPTFKDNLSKKELNSVNEIMRAAEKGTLTTLEVN